MSNVNERYTPIPIPSNGTITNPSSNQVGGFACLTSGTLTLANNAGLTILAAFPVTAGVYHPLPFLTQNGWTVTLGGGASGALAYI